MAVREASVEAQRVGLFFVFGLWQADLLSAQLECQIYG